MLVEIQIYKYVNYRTEESIWSLYALGKCSVSEFFKDMVSTFYVHVHVVDRMLR